MLKSFKKSFATVGVILLAQASGSVAIAANQPIHIVAKPAASKPIHIIAKPGTSKSIHIMAKPAVHSPSHQSTSPSKTNPSKKAKPEKKQMWNLQNADIQAVVETISQLTGKNFVVDPRVQGKVTLISAKPMSVDEMYRTFLSMLQVMNYSAVPSGNVIKIIPSMDAKGYGGTLVDAKHPGVGDQVVVRVVPVNNVSATQLVSILQPLMPNSGSVSAYQPSNSLVLAGVASSVNQLVEIIHNLDLHSGSDVEVVHLKYADATKLAQVLQQLQSANSNQGKSNNTAVVADQAQNTLLVSGNTDNKNKEVALIKELDTASAAGSNNTAVIRLNYLTAKKVSDTLTKLAHGYVEQAKSQHGASSQSFGVGGDVNASVSIQPIADDNAVVISGPHQIVQSLQAVIKQIDIRPQQVLVQAIIVKIDETTAQKLGIEWGMVDPSSSSSSSATTDDSTDGGSSVGSLVGSAAESYFTGGMGFIKTGNFRILIHSLASSGDTDILSTPSVLVLNNQKATLSDGQNIGILSRQNMTNVSNGADGTVPFNNYDRKDVTLSLDVTPQIAPDNTVRLTLSQKDDSLAAAAQSDDSGNPTINTSKIKTTVMVNSGDTLVLGGLISNTTTTNDHKVPILGDIPILGKLFHYTDNSTDKKNLMIFIRPVILNTREEAKKKSLQEYNYIRYQQMRRRDGLGVSNSDKFPVLPAEQSKGSAATKLPSPFN